MPQTKKKKDKEKRPRPQPHLAFRASAATLSTFQMPPADGESPKGDSLKKEVLPQPMNATYSAEQRALAMEQLMATPAPGSEPLQQPLQQQQQPQPKGKPSSARFWTSFALAAAKKRLMLAKTSTGQGGELGARTAPDVGPPGALKGRTLSESGKQIFMEGTADGSPFGHHRVPPPHVLQSSITQQPSFALQQQQEQQRQHQQLFMRQQQQQQQQEAKAPSAFFGGIVPAQQQQQQSRTDGSLPVAQLVPDSATHPSASAANPFGAPFGSKPGFDMPQRLQLNAMPSAPAASTQQQQQQQHQHQQQQLAAAQAAAVLRQRQQQQQQHQQLLQAGQQSSKPMGMGLTLSLNPSMSHPQPQQQQQPVFLPRRPTSLTMPMIFTSQQKQQQQQQRRRHPDGSASGSGSAKSGSSRAAASGDLSPSYFNRASHEARRAEYRSSHGSDGEHSFHHRPSSDFGRVSQRNSAQDEFFAFIDRNSFERGSLTDRNSFLSVTDRNSFTGRPSAEDYARALGGGGGGAARPNGPGEMASSGAPNPLATFNSNTSSASVFAARGSMQEGNGGWRPSEEPIAPTPGDPPPTFPINFQWDILGGEGGDGADEDQSSADKDVAVPMQS